MAEWIKVRSWHLVETVSRGGQSKTYCGRWVDSPRTPEPPNGEKTCETCFRVRESQA